LAEILVAFQHFGKSAEKTGSPGIQGVDIGSEWRVAGRHSGRATRYWLLATQTPRNPKEPKNKKLTAVLTISFEGE